MKGGVSGHELDVLFGAAELERDAVGWEEPDNVEQQTRRQDYGALPDDLRLERNAQADVHVGRLEFTAASRGEELNSRQRLDRAARRGDSAHGLKLSKQSLALAGDLHDEYLILDVEVIGVCAVLITAQMAAASGNTGVCEEQASLSRGSVGTTATDDVRELFNLVNSLLIEVHALGHALAGM